MFVERDSETQPTIRKLVLAFGSPSSGFLPLRSTTGFSFEWSRAFLAALDG
jgi:hypothetical protein